MPSTIIKRVLKGKFGAGSNKWITVTIGQQKLYKLKYREKKKISNNEETQGPGEYYKVV